MSTISFGSPDSNGVRGLSATPAAWSSGTTYAAGDPVSYGGQLWVAQAASTNVTPGTDTTKWQNSVLSLIENDLALSTAVTAQKPAGTAGQVQVANGSGGFAVGSNPWTINPTTGNLSNNAGTFQVDPSGNAEMVNSTVSGNLTTPTVNFGTNYGHISYGDPIYGGKDLQISNANYGVQLQPNGGEPVICGSTLVLNSGADLYMNGQNILDPLNFRMYGGSYFKQTVTGSRASGAALSSLLTQLDAMKVIVNSTTT